MAHLIPEPSHRPIPGRPWLLVTPCLHVMGFYATRSAAQTANRARPRCLVVHDREDGWEVVV